MTAAGSNQDDAALVVVVALARPIRFGVRLRSEWRQNERRHMDARHPSRAERRLLRTPYDAPGNGDVGQLIALETIEAAPHR